MDNIQPEMPKIEDVHDSRWSRHRMAILICVTVIISLILVSVSITMYNLNGTAQLDLSRPGYEGVNTRLDEEVAQFQEYATSGEITSESLEEFRTLFSSQAANAQEIDSFSTDPLNPVSLGIESSESERQD